MAMTDMDVKMMDWIVRFNIVQFRATEKEMTSSQVLELLKRLSEIHLRIGPKLDYSKPFEYRGCKKLLRIDTNVRKVLHSRGMPVGRINNETFIKRSW